jgi:hypothetical protein
MFLFVTQELRFLRVTSFKALLWEVLVQEQLSKILNLVGSEDDGIEIFGGAVNVTNLVIANFR